MALTYTPAGQLGDPVPDFKLPDTFGRIRALHDFREAGALVVMFICGHCPYVIAVEERLLALAREMQPKGAAFVGICSNDPADYPEDQPAALAARVREKNYPFPYLIDSDQKVARAFGAVCTPDLYVYDRGRQLAYRGRLDDSWRNASQVKQRELHLAIQQVLAGKTVEGRQNPSMGCSIKWK